MRFSKLFIQTLREAPCEARLPAHQLMLRAGMIRPGSPGSFGFLPLGVTAQNRIRDLVVRCLLPLGGQEVHLPFVQPRELWRATSKTSTPPRTASFRDTGQHELVLSPDLAPVVLSALVGTVQSYRQLPLLLYLSWQGFFDDTQAAPGPFGPRETYLLDSYCLHAGAAESNSLLSEVHTAITGVMQALSLPFVRAEAEGGEKLVFALPGGPEAIIQCHTCGYAADQETATAARKPPPPELPAALEEVATPDCKTIAELAAFLRIPAARTAKAVFLVASFDAAPDRFIFAVLRGDTNLNESRLCKVLGAKAVGPATEAEIRQAGAEPGYGSPLGLSGVTVVVDDLAAKSPNLVAGANRHGYHIRNVNCGRDFQATLVADITLAQAEDPCPRCGLPLQLASGIEIARTTRLGTVYSVDLGATYLDGDGQTRPLQLGHTRVWLDRVLAAVVQSHHDEHGIVWPEDASPYLVYLMTVGKATPEVVAAAEQLYESLERTGVAVLYDDRDERAGVKFNDADLLGMPLRVAIGERGLKSGVVELKRRGQAEVETVPLDSVLDLVGRTMK